MRSSPSSSSATAAYPLAPLTNRNLVNADHDYTTSATATYLAHHDHHGAEWLHIGHPATPYYPSSTSSSSLYPSSQQQQQQLHQYQPPPPLQKHRGRTAALLESSLRASTIPLSHTVQPPFTSMPPSCQSMSHQIHTCDTLYPAGQAWCACWGGAPPHHPDLHQHNHHLQQDAAPLYDYDHRHHHYPPPDPWAQWCAEETPMYDDTPVVCAEHGWPVRDCYASHFHQHEPLHHHFSPVVVGECHEYGAPVQQDQFDYYHALHYHDQQHPHPHLQYHLQRYVQNQHHHPNQQPHNLAVAVGYPYPPSPLSTLNFASSPSTASSSSASPIAAACAAHDGHFSERDDDMGCPPAAPEGGCYPDEMVGTGDAPAVVQLHHPRPRRPISVQDIPVVLPAASPLPLPSPSSATLTVDSDGTAVDATPTRAMTAVTVVGPGGDACTECLSATSLLCQPVSDAVLLEAGKPLAEQVFAMCQEGEEDGEDEEEEGQEEEEEEEEETVASPVAATESAASSFYNYQYGY